MTSHEQAVEAKRSLRTLLSGPDWLRGVGVTSSPDGGYAILVLVDAVTDGVTSKVPADHEGVTVLVRAVGDVEAQTREVGETGAPPQLESLTESAVAIRERLGWSSTAAEQAGHNLETNIEDIADG